MRNAAEGGAQSLVLTAALVAAYLCLNTTMNMLNRWALGIYGEKPSLCERQSAGTSSGLHRTLLPPSPVACYLLFPRLLACYLLFPRLPAQL